MLPDKTVYLQHNDKDEILISGEKMVYNSVGTWDVFIKYKS